MVRYTEDLSMIGDVITAFWDEKYGFTRKYPLIILAGNLFFDSEGKNVTAEFFLRGFLTEYLRGFGSRPALDTVTAAARDKKEKDYLINEIMEDCVAFLGAHFRKLKPDTRWAVEAVINGSSHPNFTLAVAERISLLRMKKAASGVSVFAGASY